MKCKKCNGDGYTAEHDLPENHGPSGECNSCPVQVQCDDCHATGQALDNQMGNPLEQISNLVKEAKELKEKYDNKKNNCLFQYATQQKIIEDTDLITREEAEELWTKYQNDIKNNWDEFHSPQMCIWVDCEKNTSYHTVGKEIDYRDCELENGRFYRVTKELIS